MSDVFLVIYDRHTTAQILTKDNEALGYINKRWPGRQQDVNCDHDSFEIHCM